MRNAVNHAGWNVQEFRGAEEGWVAVVGPFEDRDFTVGYCKWLQALTPTKEFRVYEAVK